MMLPTVAGEQRLGGGGASRLTYAEARLQELALSEGSLLGPVCRQQLETLPYLSFSY